MLSIHNFPTNITFLPKQVQKLIKVCQSSTAKWWKNPVRFQWNLSYAFTELRLLSTLICVATTGSSRNTISSSITIFFVVDTPYIRSFANGCVPLRHVINVSHQICSIGNGQNAGCGPECLMCAFRQTAITCGEKIIWKYERKNWLNGGERRGLYFLLWRFLYHLRHVSVMMIYRSSVGGGLLWILYAFVVGKTFSCP